MDSLLATVVIILIYAVSGWLQKKAEARQAGSGDKKGGSASPPGSRRAVKGPADPNQRTPAPAPAMDWQRELRRLLEGDLPEDSSAPTVKHEPPVPATPPVISKPKAAPPMPATSALVSHEGPETSRLTEAAGAYRRAQHLHHEASVRLHQVVEQAKRREPKGTRAIRRAVSPEIVSAVALVRNPATVRQAVMASIVLGPPKGLES